MRPVGRPKKGSGCVRNVETKVRLTSEEARVLDELCVELNLTKAEVLRRGLEIQYNMLTFDF